jgi:hypothetical protein
MLSRRAFLTGASVTPVSTLKSPVKIPLFAAHAITIGALFQNVKEVYPSLPLPKKEYAIKLLEAYDLATSMIEDEDLREALIDKLAQPLAEQSEYFI